MAQALTVVVLALVAAIIGAVPAGAAADPARDGRWSAPFWEGGASAFDPPSAERAKRYPVAATAVVLPDGRLLYWNALEGSENGDVWVAGADNSIVLENARVRLLDLRSPEPRWTTSVLERGTTHDPQAGRPVRDLFCADQKLLYDGRVLVAGGSRWDIVEETAFPEPRGVASTSVFDPASDSFRPVGDMREPRWYPSLVTLPDGRVSVTSGVRRVVSTFANPARTARSSTAEQASPGTRSARPPIRRPGACGACTTRWPSAGARRAAPATACAAGPRR